MGLGLAWALLLLVGWSKTRSPELFTLNLVATYASIWIWSWLGFPSARRKVMLRFALVSASLLLVCAFFETFAVLKLLDYRVVFRTPIISPPHDPNNVLDEELIFRRKAHSRRQGSFRGGNLSFLWDVPDATLHHYDLRYDENGFRNSEDLEYADIVVLGDSFVEGNYVSDAEVLTTVLARLQGATVANLGLSSYGPQQQLAALRRYGLPLGPKTVVVVFFEGNDLKDVFSYRRFRAEGPEPRHSLVARSFTKNLLLSLYALAGSPRPSALPRSGLVEGPGGHLQRAYFMYPSEPWQALQAEALQVAKQVMAREYALCSEAGVRFIVAFAPIKYRVYAELMEVEPDSQLAEWAPNDVLARLREAIHDLSPDIEFVDLTGPLVDSARRGELPYFADDSHWSPVGHRVAAKALSEAIERGADAPR